MTDDEIHARAIALLRERTEIQRTIRGLGDRITEIDNEIVHLDEQLGYAPDKPR